MNISGHSTKCPHSKCSLAAGCVGEGASSLFTLTRTEGGAKGSRDKGWSPPQGGQEHDTLMFCGTCTPPAPTRGLCLCSGHLDYHPAPTGPRIPAAGTVLVAQASEWPGSWRPRLNERERWRETRSSCALAQPDGPWVTFPGQVSPLHV